MGDDTDLIKLYSGRILALAADIPNLGHLEAPDATVKKRAPLCGSTVTVEINVDNETVIDFAQDVKACALGQAAAAVVGGNVIGSTRSQIVAARDSLEAMLQSDGPAPLPPFDGLEVLRPAKGYKNRHASILLCLSGLVEAMEKTGRKNCA